MLCTLVFASSLSVRSWVRIRFYQKSHWHVRKNKYKLFGSRCKWWARHAGCLHQLPWDVFYAFTAQNVRRCCEPGVVAITRAPVRFLLVCAVQRALDACLLWIHGKHWRLCIIIASLPIARSVLHSCSDVLFGFFMVLLYSGAVPLGCLVLWFLLFQRSASSSHTPNPCLCERQAFNTDVTIQAFQFLLVPSKMYVPICWREPIDICQMLFNTTVTSQMRAAKKAIMFHEKQIVLDETNWLSLFPYEQNKD